MARSIASAHNADFFSSFWVCPSARRPGRVWCFAPPRSPAQLTVLFNFVMITPSNFRGALCDKNNDGWSVSCFCNQLFRSCGGSLFTDLGLAECDHLFCTMWRV